MPQHHTETISHLRVIKKLGPTSRGAIKLADQFGRSLICVRHRVDAHARIRFTTVELLVAQAPIKPRPTSQKLVAVQINWEDQALRQIVKAAGGRWDSGSRTWLLPQRLAGILRIAHLIKPR